MRTILIVAILLLLSCTNKVMVSNLDFLEPVYGISKKQIISIDTTSDGYQPLYIVKYRVNK